jgi:uncharacterized MnhB-related membrane protein
MQIDYVSAIIVLVALSFSLVVAFLAFHAARSAKTEAASEVGTRFANLCYECLGSSNLDERRMSECASACGVMPV